MMSDTTTDTTADLAADKQEHDSNQLYPAAFVDLQTRKSWWILVVVTLLVILLDQGSKWLVSENLARGESWMPLDAVYPIFRLTHVHNTGAAFGIFPEGGAIFLVIALIVSTIILYFYHQLPADAWLVRIALGLQLGGALGNVIDRLRQGYVTDFFHVDFWPVFNVADSAIVVGVVLLAIEILWEDWQSSRASRNEPSPREHAETRVETPPDSSE